MNIPQLSPAQALRDAEAHRHNGALPLLLDVREPWEVATAAATAPVFESLCVPMQQVPGALERIDRQQPVYVLCHHGMRSLQVALFLRSQGYERVYNIAGGIDAWSRDVDPTVPSY